MESEVLISNTMPSPNPSSAATAPSPTEGTSECSSLFRTDKGGGLSIFDIKGVVPRNKKTVVAELVLQRARVAVGLYEHASSVMTGDDLFKLRDRLARFGVSVNKNAAKNPISFRIIKKTEQADKVDLFFVDCLFPGNPQVEWFREAMASKLQHSSKPGPYAAKKKIPEHLNDIEGNDMSNIQVINGQYTIPLPDLSAQ
ncbi:unnamed protein product [Clonostachys rosea]|uniref:Uncharacterized protein n=1 Tax=Bionectria ochroleuca TaxID=29856 RepID=A0ABY6U2F4_BIOOC|nr:unnamed protein product [Clonostachys rosea]